MKLYVLFIGLLLIGYQSYGQVAKEVIPSNQVWFAYYNQTRLSNKWSIWFDTHLRRTNFLGNWTTQIFRPGLVYHLSDQAQLMSGYSYARFYSTKPAGDVQPEHRLWQQLTWDGKLGRVETSHWVRVEERFRHNLVNEQLAPGYGFNWRLRVMVSGQLPLWGTESKPGVPSLLLQEEIWFNAGRQIVYNYFDQNRLFLGIVYPFSEQWRIQAGYMNVFQQEKTGNSFQNKHVLRLFLYHNLDFR